MPRVRREGYRFFQVADPVAPALALGIAIGRIGDLIIADHLGRPTGWLLAWTYRGGTIAPPFSCQEGFCQASLHEGHLETISREGARLLDEAGQVVAEGVGVHTLRHSAAVGWLEAGVHIKAVADMLGQSSIAVTGDIYGHTSDDTARAAVDGWSGVLGL